MKRWKFGLLLICGLAVAAVLIKAANPPKPFPVYTVRSSPPKPPDCPSSPELPNLALSDGSIADVRIVGDGSFKLYIPFSWMKFGWPIGKLGLQSMPVDPEIESVECAGVVHEAVPVEVGGANWGVGYVTPFFLAENGAFQIALKKDEIFGSIRIDPYGQKAQDYIVFSLDHDAAIIRINDKYWAYYYIPRLARFFPRPWGIKEEDDAYAARLMAGPEWALWRSSALELVEWLRTPPKDRDNERFVVNGGKI